MKTVKPHVRDGSWALFLLLSLENSQLNSGSNLITVNSISVTSFSLNTDLRFSAVLGTALDSQVCMVIQDLSTSFEDNFGYTKTKCVPCAYENDVTFEYKTPTVRYSYNQPPTFLNIVDVLKEGNFPL